MKKYNFNAGPSMLPREVIEKTAQQCLDFNGSGLSLMEISHRAKDFQPVVDEAVALVKELLDIPEGYSHLPRRWCQSGVLHDSFQLPD
jgi:phosphoserine aminotransferase